MTPPTTTNWIIGLNGMSRQILSPKRSFISYITTHSHNPEYTQIDGNFGRMPTPCEVLSVLPNSFIITVAAPLSNPPGSNISPFPLPMPQTLIGKVLPLL